MNIASRTPEGWNGRCPICDLLVVIEPSQPTGDAPCPSCGHLLWDLTPPPPPIVEPIVERVEGRVPDEVAFEATAWKSGGLRLRGSQAPDLLRRRLLIGVSSWEVSCLLGQPDEQGPKWVGYALDRGVRITIRGYSHRLRVYFDSEGNVRDVQIIER